MLTAAALVAAAVLALTACSGNKKQESEIEIATIPATVHIVYETEESYTAGNKSADQIIHDMIVCYGYKEDEGLPTVEQLMAELKEIDEDKWKLWSGIFEFWEYTKNEQQINIESVPEGLENDDSLCIVVLGYRLQADGSIRPELEGRLKTALNAAFVYDKALVCVTGGGTAANKNVTEAGQMKAWLVENGLDENRIIVEDKSLTTGQNAINAYNILRKDYPQVDSIMVVSSDYHIGWGSILLEAQCRIGGESEGGQKISVVGNSAYEAHSTEKYPFSYQAAGLLELAGFGNTASSIYSGTYK